MMAGQCKITLTNIGWHSTILNIAISVVEDFHRLRGFKIGQHSAILIMTIFVIKERSKACNSGQHSAILIIAMYVRVAHQDKLRFCNLRQHSATLIIAASSKELSKSRDLSIGQYVTILLKAASVIEESSVPHPRLEFYRNSSMASNFIYLAAIFPADILVKSQDCALKLRSFI
jgi:hypothetical protein